MSTDKISKALRVLQERGFEESCPRRRYWIYVKYPFEVYLDLWSGNVTSHRLDKKL